MKRKILFTVCVCFVLTYTIAFAQADLDQPQTKLTKNDRILLTVYDDTTRAIAALFITKRNNIKKGLKTTAIVGGVSASLFLIGGLVFEQNINTPAGSYNPSNYAGLGIMFFGAAGVLASAASLPVQFLLLNPYTMKKHHKLMKIYRSGRPLPEFYKRNLSAYLK